MSETTPFATAIVVGASSGIGEALVRLLSTEGTRVACVARRQAELDRIVAENPGKLLAYAHDVTAYDEAPPLFDRICRDLGSVELFVYNAGIMPRIDEHEYDFAKDRAMVEVNLLGAMAWMNPVAAYMESRRGGTIAGIGSVAGDRGRRGNPAYHTTKGALAIYLESLRNRLSRYGVDVVTVKPGPVRTPMTEGLKLPLMISAERCASEALDLMHLGTGEGYTPPIWAPIMLAIRNVPSVIFRRTNI